MNIFETIQGLIQQAKKVALIKSLDEVYVRNQILHLLKIDSFPKKTVIGTNDSIPNLLENLIQFAVNHHVIQDVLDDKEMLSANIMNCFVPLPSVVNELFHQKYKAAPQEATNYFYKLSQHSNYIQTKRIAKNVHFKSDTKYGKLDITINLSKPEKDPDQIKRERETKQSLDYPTCVLCRENEGYAGRIGYPARANHRVIQMSLLDENWFFQYSPYVYYNEHSILLSEEHRPMKIDARTFERLLTFVDMFPHYFIGSNADLPIVGGSILGHDHYQAGRYEFAMTNAVDDFHFKLEEFPYVSASFLKWPLSVIRLRGKQKQDIVRAATHILTAWQQYEDVENNIIHKTNEEPHNTITPIARMAENGFEMDLVLRNNRTTVDYPMGIFHPHEDVHHIKKENIGLIEVMGLAVLPARLKTELQEITHYLMDKKSVIKNYHKDWAEFLLEKYGPLKDFDTATNIVQQELGYKFVKVLEDAGVFKQNSTGKAACKKFIDELNK